MKPNHVRHETGRTIVAGWPVAGPVPVPRELAARTQEAEAPRELADSRRAHVEGDQETEAYEEVILLHT